MDAAWMGVRGERLRLRFDQQLASYDGLAAAKERNDDPNALRKFFRQPD